MELPIKNAAKEVVSIKTVRNKSAGNSMNEISARRGEIERNFEEAFTKNMEGKNGYGAQKNVWKTK